MDLRYKLHQEVMIKKIGMAGIVEEVSIGVYGIKYSVSYWNNGERYSVYVNEVEIMEVGDGEIDSGGKVYNIYGSGDNVDAGSIDDCISGDGLEQGCRRREVIGWDVSGK